MTKALNFRTSRRWLIICVSALALLAVAWSFTPTRGPTAPAFDVGLVDGGRLTSAQLRGQVVLLNFWATDCTTCVGEMPQLVDTQRALGPRGLRTVAIALARNDPAYVRNFAHARALPFDIAWDADGSVAQAYGNVHLTPTSVLIDRHGHVVARYVGAPDFAALQRQIQGLLDKA